MPLESIGMIFLGSTVGAQLQVMRQKVPALRIVFIATVHQQKYPPAVECLEFPS